MKRALLDINVLLALLDRNQPDHLQAREWLDREIRYGWASCALTQNGFVRVMSQPKYPYPVSPSVASALLKKATLDSHHEFWSGSLSILDDERFDRSRIHGPRQVTDAWLLALAVENDGRFVTFDQAIPVSAVRNATLDRLVVL